MPDLYLIGGPNGAGKTTIALQLFPDILQSREVVVLGEGKVVEQMVYDDETPMRDQHVAEGGEHNIHSDTSTGANSWH